MTDEALEAANEGIDKPRKDVENRFSHKFGDCTPQQRIHVTMSQQDRAVTPVISTILMVALAVILAATVSVAFFDITENINEPAPIVGDTTGDFVVDAPTPSDNQFVRITHIAGESVRVEEIEIVVRASGLGTRLPKETRLIALPASGSSLNNENVRGDLVTQGSGDDQIVDGDPGVTWSPGDTIQFRINTGAADFRIDEINTDAKANTLDVSIVHTPYGEIISQSTFTS